MFTLQQWEEQLRLQDSCNHSALGSCVMPCPECGTYGFYGIYSDDERRYCLCKWCGHGQDVGGEPFKCYLEMCPVCFPDDLIKKLEGVESPEVRLFNSAVDGVRLTMQPGHPCPKCNITMTVRDGHTRAQEIIKKEIYEIHQYKEKIQ